MAKEKLTSISLHQEMQRSYLEYAMSVIVGRALPDAKDGLKPVQRRILFAMHELGLTPDRPFRKCARVVGDVLGKYHPHGDQAVYDALVRLVQDFSTKHPVLDGHGNFGSVDDDPPAAMRYTETRLSPISHQTLLQEIDSNTVTYSDNFDGSQKEPDVLPAQLPFLLLNGSSGIAVGMATNIPPHNLGEVIDGLIALIRNKEINYSKLTQIIRGPDFPTGGELLYSETVSEMYEKGRGSVTIRGVISPEEIIIGKGKHKRKSLIIKELPYQISKAGWIEKLAEMVNAGKINGISDIRDESDRDGMRIVIEIKRDYNQELLISDLYKKTTLQTNFGAIFLALVNGKPIQLSLKGYLQQFALFREETIKKRTKFYFDLASSKLEILEGFSLAVKNIKSIVEIVQNSEDSSEAKYLLQKELKLSTKQADTVLGMPIKKLTNLERNQIQKDIQKLKGEKNYLNKILNNRDLLIEKLIEELSILKKKYNTKRKTKIIKNHDTKNEVELINKKILEECIDKKTKLIIEEKFYLRKLNFNSYKKLLEAGNKFIGNKLSYRFSCDINEDLKIIAITYTGKILNINWYNSINQDCKLDNKLLNNLNPSDILNFHSFRDNTKNYLCIISNDGRFKKLFIDEEMIKTNRSFSIIKSKNNNMIIDSFISNEKNNLVILTSIGRLFRFELDNKFIPLTSKQAQGIVLLKLFPSEKIISFCKCKDEDNIVIATKKGMFFKLYNQEIYNSSNSKLGYINDKFLLKKDSFFKIFNDKEYIEITTNKERHARIMFSELESSKKKIYIQS